MLKWKWTRIITTRAKNKKKKKKNKYYSDDEFIGNGKIRKIKTTNNSDNDSGSETSENGFKRKSTRQRRKKFNSDDEEEDDEIDISGDKLNETSDEDYNSDNDSIVDGVKTKTQHKPRGRKRKSRIDELLNSDDYASSNDGSNGISKKMTFDQYIKILTGNSNSTNATTPTLTTAQSNSSTLISSTAVANASKLIKNINIDKLKVPIINPVVTAVLEANKMKQQHQYNEESILNNTSASSNNSDNDFVNVDNLSKSIQIIAMPSLSTPNSKILNSNGTSNLTGVSTIDTGGKYFI